jgi:hypothetical protein
MSDRPIEELIAASSLGSPEVVAVRAEAGPALVERVLKRADELELPTELRWRCGKCGKDFAEGQCVAFVGRDMLSQLAGGAYGLMPPQETVELFTSLADVAEHVLRSGDLFVPLSGPPERGHTISWSTGGRPGVMGGSTRHTDVCGPVRLTLIETQELWVEYVMGARA